MNMDEESRKTGDLNAQLVFELAVVNLNWQKLCDYFGIPMKNRYNPNCAEWVIKWIKAAEHSRLDKRPDEMFAGSATPEDLPEIVAPSK